MVILKTKFSLIPLGLFLKPEESFEDETKDLQIL